MIIFANVKFMGEGLESGFMSLMNPGLTPSEKTWETAVLAFVNGKWRSLLLLVFGAGLAIQYMRRTNAGDWPTGHIKRYAWLYALGLLHFVLIWDGDILMMYSLAGILGLGVLKMPQDRLLKWIKVGIGGIGILCILIVLASTILNFIPPEDLDLESLHSGTSGSSESAILALGTYLDQVLHRLTILPGYMVLNPILLAPLAPLPLLGMWWMRNGFFSSTPEGLSARRKAMTWGFGLGIPMNLAVLLFAQSNLLLPHWIWIESIAGPVLSVGSLALGAEIWLKPGLLAETLAKVGRMAMSAYVFQSIAGTAIFYSWGLRQFGKLTMPGYLLIALGISLLTWSFCAVWSQLLGQGPLERLWRKLSATPGSVPTYSPRK